MINTNWDLSHLYASNEEFLKDFEVAKNMLKNLEKFKNNLGKNDKKILLNYFKTDDEISVILERLESSVLAKANLSFIFEKKSEII